MRETTERINSGMADLLRAGVETRSIKGQGQERTRPRSSCHSIPPTARRAILFWRRKRLAAVIRTFDVARLVHPERKLAGMTVANRLSRRDITLAVLRDRNPKGIAHSLWLAYLIRHQTGLDKRRKIAECAVVLLSIARLKGDQALEQVFDIRLMLLNQSIEEKSVALFYDLGLFGFGADDPDTSGINQRHGLGSNLGRAFTDRDLDEDSRGIAADLFAHNLDLFGNLCSLLLKVHPQICHLVGSQSFDCRFVNRHCPCVFEAMLAHGFVEFAHDVGRR